MKAFIVLSVSVVAVFGSFVDDINWNNVTPADFSLEELKSEAPGPDISIEERIFGGIIAKPHQFPYQVLLNMVKYNEHHKKYYILCGGALISREFVLTAGHCVVGVSRARVYLGVQYKSNPEKRHSMIEVSREYIFVHPLYEGKKINDIALIKLLAPVALNNFIRTIKLPRPTMLKAKLEGKMVIMTGWGRNGNSGNTSNALRYANVRILPESSCALPFPYIVNSHICVSGHVQSQCPGDSGDPLVAQETDGTKVLVGIGDFMSWEGCEKGIPTVFTRVTSFLDWILLVTKIPIRH